MGSGAQVLPRLHFERKTLRALPCRPCFVASAEHFAEMADLSESASGSAFAFAAGAAVAGGGAGVVVALGGACVAGAAGAGVVVP